MTGDPPVRTDPELGVTAARGFRAGAAAAGIKASGKPDVAVLASDLDAAAAAVFTTNRVVGAPVLVSREHLARRRRMRGVVVSSGCSNVCTGEQGLKDAREMAGLAARSLGCPAEAILVASTGVIGRFLPMDRVRAGVAAACAHLAAGPEADRAFAEAILTTDTRPKQAGARLVLGGRTVTLAGATKGVGMIEPAMATTLSFLATDAAVEPGFLQAALGRAVARTYNCLTIDGHQSTSDTMAVLASGLAMEGAPPMGGGSPDAPRFEAALEAVCAALAREIAADAEGGTKVIEVSVTGAATPDEARRAARAIANSPLVKCAFFGEDPNWGRIVSAAGGAGISAGPETMRLKIGGLLLFERGRPTGADPDALKAAMRARDIAVHLDLGAGRGQARYLTCDLSTDYVKINAEYTT
jgi:glutamate N-acetyltransferase/amino-acid N-acetyltransferase